MKKVLSGIFTTVLTLVMIFFASSCISLSELMDASGPSDSSRTVSSAPAPSSSAKGNGTTTVSDDGKTTTTVSADGKTITTVTVEDVYKRKTDEPVYTTSYSPGNIVYSDGTMTNYYTLDTSKTPVAVIFDAKNKLGVALTGKELSWAPAQAAGHRAALKTSDVSGEKNWDVIKAADPQGTSTPAKCDENYPAFYYCANYSTKGYENGWYMPSKDEMKTLMYWKSNVEAALKKIPGAEPLNPRGAKGYSDSYWSSSQYISENPGSYGQIFAWAIDTTGYANSNSKEALKYVRPVHKF